MPGVASVSCFLSSRETELYAQAFTRGPTVGFRGLQGVAFEGRAFYRGEGKPLPVSGLYAGYCECKPEIASGRSIPTGESALAASRAYAAHPHLASSKEDYQDALVILKLFQEEFDIPAPDVLPVFSAGSRASRSATLGINKLSKPTTWVDTYYPIMNTPLDRTLQILDADGSVAWNADLVEDGDPADPEAAKYKDYVPTFHGLSANGEVQGPLIYANYGTQEDYQELLTKGTNFTGKLVLTRYGGIFRGLKVGSRHSMYADNS